MPKETPVDLTAYEVGQTVSHDKFGKGTVTELQPDRGRITVDFRDCGIKTLAVDKARLTILQEP